MKRKTIRLDQDTMLMLERLDEKLNLKSNHNAVIVLAIQRLHAEELSNRLDKQS